MKIPAYVPTGRASSRAERPPSPGGCGKAVDEPSNSCALPVNEKKFRHASGAYKRCMTLLKRLRDALRLFPPPGSIQFPPFPTTPNVLGAANLSTLVHRFEQQIAGHPYLIEVKSVARDRWRAYILRTPGVPTALMPFYGPTPGAAAEQLCQWLTRAHERAKHS